jgi:hypothetical protein
MRCPSSGAELILAGKETSNRRAEDGTVWAGISREKTETASRINAKRMGMMLPQTLKVYGQSS